LPPNSQKRHKFFIISPYEYLLFEEKNVTIETYDNDGNQIKTQQIPVAYNAKGNMLIVAFSIPPKLNCKSYTESEHVVWKIIFDNEFENMIFVYDSPKSEPLNLFFTDLRFIDTMNSPQEYSVSSWIQLEGEEFCSEYLNNRAIGSPWISNSSDKDEYKKIILMIYSKEFQRNRKEEGKSYHIMDRGYKQLYSGFWISVGYLNYNNDNLYREYSRPKTIMINNDLEQVYNLKDSPNLQYIELKYPVEKVEITIIATYRGITYKNVAVNFILPVNFFEKLNDEEIQPLSEEEKQRMIENLFQFFEEYEDKQ
jgi:hypothetical protein